MDIQTILGVPQTAEAMYMQAQYLRVRDFLAGRHKVYNARILLSKTKPLKQQKLFCNLSRRLWISTQAIFVAIP